MRTWASYCSDAGRGASENEDRCGFRGSLGWVVDGASALPPSGVAPAFGGGALLADLLDKALWRRGNEAAALERIVSDAVADTVLLWEETAGPASRRLSELKPSACLGLARIRDDELDYWVLGDCHVVARAKGGALVHITDRRVTALDERVVEEMADAMRRGGQTHAEARRAHDPLISHNRSLMNTESGYWVVTLDAAGLDHALTGTLAIESSSRVVLCTDGMAAIVDVFGAASFATFLEPGWSPFAALATLRHLELTDQECTRFPRLKLSDDATALVSATVG